MVPNGWNFKTLDELAIVERGKFSARPRNDPRYYGGSIPFVQTGDIASSKTYLTDYSQTLNEEGLKVSNLFPKNTILITIAANIGDTAITSFDVACPDSLVAIQPVAEKADTYWLKKILETRKTELDGQATQNAQKNINLQVLKPLNILTPPIEEQRKIAKILSTWDKAISATERLIDNSKQQKKALMQQLLTGKKRLLDESGKPFEGKWEEVKLKECATCLDNKRVPLNSSQRQEMQGEIPYWGANGIVDYVNEHIFDETIVLLAEDGGYFDEFSHRPIANISYGKSWVNNHAHILKAKNNSLNEWLYYSLVHKNILAFINGGTRAKLNKSDMLLIPINLPPIAEQTKIVGVLGNADQEISLLEKQLADLKQEKKALMQQLLTGKRRVKINNKECVA